MDNVSLDQTTTAARPSVLSLVIKERAGLYSAYMPFIEGGGIFIPTQKEYTMGDPVYVIVQLMGEAKRYSVACKVVWVSPAGMPQKSQGIGVQIPYDEAGKELREFIEAALGSAIGSSRKTHTL